MEKANHVLVANFNITIVSYVSFRENNILAKNSEFTVCDLLLNLGLNQYHFTLYISLKF